MKLTGPAAKRRRSTLNTSTDKTTPSNDLTLNDSWSEILANVPITVDKTVTSTTRNLTTANNTNNNPTQQKEQNQQSACVRCITFISNFHVYSLTCFVADRQSAYHCQH